MKLQQQGLDLSFDFQPIVMCSLNRSFAMASQLSKQQRFSKLNKTYFILRLEIWVLR